MKKKNQIKEEKMERCTIHHDIRPNRYQRKQINYEQNIHQRKNQRGRNGVLITKYN